MNNINEIVLLDLCYLELYISRYFHDNDDPEGISMGKYSTGIYELIISLYEPYLVGKIHHSARRFINKMIVKMDYDILGFKVIYSDGESSYLYRDDNILYR